MELKVFRKSVFFMKLSRYSRKPGLGARIWEKKQRTWNVIYWDYFLSKFLIHTGKSQHRDLFFIKLIPGLTVSGMAGSRGFE